MRTKALFSTVLLLCTFFSFAQTTTPLVGTWKLVSGKAVINDSAVTYGSPNYESIKIVTPTHFTVFSQTPSVGTIQQVGAGRVKVDATQYTEYLDYSSTKEMVSKTATFTYKVDGNKWYIKGGTDNMKFDEVWQRVE